MTINLTKIKEQENTPKVERDLKVTKLSTSVSDKLQKQIDILNEPGVREKFLSVAKNIDQELEKMNREEIEQDLNFNTQKLLNKNGMTDKDKEGMKKVIKLLRDARLDSLENYEKLLAINYTKDYIDIGGTKRAREDVRSNSNNETILRDGNATYFADSQIKSENIILGNRNMQIPDVKDYRKSFNVLPSYGPINDAEKGTLLAIIVNMDMAGCYNGSSKNSGYGYRWTLNGVWYLTFGETFGRLESWPRGIKMFYQIRPIYKS